MNYNDFEWTLCNRVFTMAVLFPSEYNNVHSLIIQNWNNSVIMITSNREETEIRVSYPDGQEIFQSYDEALEGIKKHIGFKR